MPEITEPSVKQDNVKAEGTESDASNGIENGVSSNSPEKKSPEKSECEVLLAQGKRYLFVKDYPNAVAVLGDACAKLDEVFGSLADECADAYFSYGRALLELSREESNVLGTEPEKEGSVEGDEEEEEDNKPKDEEVESPADCETKENENQSSTEETVSDETIDTTKEANEEEEEGEDSKDDIDNLQLAWEVLELAKKIFERQNSKAKLAETHLYLGEVQLESENYSGAIEDMKQCIAVQKEILSPDHREIAETYFQMGVACSLDNQFDTAIENFKTSSEILQTRIKNLEENGASQVETDKNPFYSVEKEIMEIKELLPEIKAKIADMEDFKQETIKGMMATLNGESHSNDGAGPSSSSSTLPAVVPTTNGSTPKPATNISHLVRKKRKPDEEAANSTESPVKKTCTGQPNL